MIYSNEFYKSEDFEIINNKVVQFKNKMKNCKFKYNMSHYIIPNIIVAILIITTLIFTNLHTGWFFKVFNPDISNDVDLMILFLILIFGCCSLIHIYKLVEKIKYSYNNSNKAKRQAIDFLQDMITILKDFNYGLRDYVLISTHVLNEYNKYKDDCKDAFHQILLIAINKYKSLNAYMLLYSAYNDLRNKYSRTKKCEQVNPWIYDREYKINTEPFLLSIEDQIEQWNDCWFWSFNKELEAYKKFNAKDIEQMTYNLERSYDISHQRRDQDLKINYEKFVAEYRLPTYTNNTD